MNKTNNFKKIVSLHKRYILFFTLILLIVVNPLFCKKKKSLPDLIQKGKVDAAKMLFTRDFDVNDTDNEGNTALHIAAKMNDVNIVTFLIGHNADIDKINAKGLTPLQLAIDNNALQAAKTLVTYGANIFALYSDDIPVIDKALNTSDNFIDIFVNDSTVKYRAEDGSTLLHHFIFTHNIAGVKAYIKGGYDLAVVDNEGRTALSLCYSDMENPQTVSMAALLIEGGSPILSTPYDYFQTALLAHNLNLRFEDGQTGLHISIILGHNAISSYLITNNAEVNVKDAGGSTPLHEAVRYERLDTIDALLVAGVLIDAKDNIGKTPFLLSMLCKNPLDIAKILIKSGAKVTSQDTYGDTIFHIASMAGVGVNTLQFLLDNGAEVNERNKEGVTPIAIALENGNKEHTAFYANHGANINTIDNKCRSPLSLALEMDEEFLELLISKNNIYMQDSSGNTPLHIAIMNNASLPKIQYILSLMDDVNLRNAEGNSALYLCVIKNRPRAAVLLLEKNADIFSVNNKNRSPLSLALNAGGRVLDWFLTKKTIEATDSAGNSALHYAASWGINEAIQAITSKGGAVDVVNSEGVTPLFFACRKDNVAVVDQLALQGASIDYRNSLGETPLHEAVKWGNILVASRLITLGASINAQNSNGKTPLALAIRGGKHELTTLLINRGAALDAQDTRGESVLIACVKEKNVGLTSLLISRGASISLQDTLGRTALHYAVIGGSAELIRLLNNGTASVLGRDKTGESPLSLAMKDVAEGDYTSELVDALLEKDKNVKDTDGNTALHIALLSKAPPSLVKHLIDWGLPLDAKNSKSYTPLSLAVEMKNAPVASVLLESGADPYANIDADSKCSVSIALENKDQKILGEIVKYAGDRTDIKGNGILHYAAKAGDAGIIGTLLSYGLSANVKNIYGDLPYTLAIRWKNAEAAAALKVEDKV